MADLLGGRVAQTIRAVNGVSLTVNRGDTLGLVGESGCGKSTLARAVLRLVDSTGGTVRFEGADVRAMRPDELFRLRRRVQMVFQDPLGSLNPQMTVAQTLSEVFRVHGLCANEEVDAQVDALMARVGLSTELAGRRPTALSGGQCQRVGIARALAVGPELIIADEAVSALDVSIQAQILNLFSRLQQQMELTLVFISHDLGVVQHICKRVAVMYLGRIVEIGPTASVFTNPRHPYTRALIEVMPRMAARSPLSTEGLVGEPPSPVDLPDGCPFHPRCPAVMPRCRSDPAPHLHVEDVEVWCHLYQNSEGAPSK